MRCAPAERLQIKLVRGTQAVGFSCALQKGRRDPPWLITNISLPVPAKDRVHCIARSLEEHQ